MLPVARRKDLGGERNSNCMYVHSTKSRIESIDSLFALIFHITY